MNAHHVPVVCLIPGDLHLTEAGLENYRAAQWVVEQANELIRPDFVQFIGDNVQDGNDAQLHLFRQLAARLTVPWHALVGDHDVQGDAAASRFRAVVGSPIGTIALRGFRFLRLNTQEGRPVGLSDRQMAWLEEQIGSALTAGERVVVFQHNYPYKVWETYDGPGIDAWRAVMQTRRIAAIFTGHTHYHQIANDGRNVAVAVRSVGDPEGGPPGYLLVYLHGDDLAATYRSVSDRGPIVLVTHPRDRLLALGPAHVVRGQDRVRARIWSPEALTAVQGRIDEGPWRALEPLAHEEWSFAFDGNPLEKGSHRLEVHVTDTRHQTGGQVLEFAVDPTGRYTAVPAVRPQVSGTKFC